MPSHVRKAIASQIKIWASRFGIEASASLSGQRMQPAEASSPEDRLNIHRYSLAALGLALALLLPLSIPMIPGSIAAPQETLTVEPSDRQPGALMGPADMILLADGSDRGSVLKYASPAANYPPDPPTDTPWEGGYAGVADIAAAFNRARANENSALGTFLKPLTLPAQSTWSGMSEGDRALWLINTERTARGLTPLHGLETHVTQVAQSWAEWLLSHNQFDHNADGRTPWERLDAVPAIKACHDFLGVAENLYWVGTTSAQGTPLPIEQAIYTWMYDDKTSAWGHRHAILWKPFTDNSGAAGQEGFLGIGHARGGFTNPADGRRFAFTDLVVMNVFDPCASWQYAAPPSVPPPATPIPTPSPTPRPGTQSAGGQATTVTWVTLESQPFEAATWPGSWRVSDADGAINGEYTWIAAPCRVFEGAYSGMAVGGGADGIKTACDANYPNNARSWMIYGPFNLSDAVAAEVQIKAWVYTEPDNDILCLAASTGGKVFNGWCFSGYSDGWVDERLDLANIYRMGSLLGRSDIYIALAFITNSSVTRPHQGAYVDNVVLRKGLVASAAAAGANATQPAGLLGVMVQDETGRWAVTNASGAFEVSGLPLGKHTLTASKPGFRFYPPSVQVDVSAGGAATVRFVGAPLGRRSVYLPVVLRAAR